MFSLASPLNQNFKFIASNDLNDGTQASGKLTPKLESIAEETQNSMSLEKKEDQSIDAPAPSGVPQLSLPVERPHSDTRDSVSPVPSEANASIDLNCDTPASASIDIGDHAIQPADKMASVLHFRASPVPAQTSQQQPQPATPEPSTPRVVEPMGEQSRAEEDVDVREGRRRSPNALINSGSHSVDSAEAAAIRIQSAFRGYHTRKHSPYRRRSPNSRSPLSLGDDYQINNIELNGNSKRLALRQQDATDVDEIDVDQEPNSRLEADGEQLESDRMAEVREEGRRQSRGRQRDNTSIGQELPSTTSTEESLATDESTIKEACQPIQSDTVQIAEPEGQLGGNGGALTEDHSVEIDSSAALEGRLLDDLDEESKKMNTGSFVESVSHEGRHLGGAIDDVAQHTTSTQPLRSSAGATSVELDTDSSILGAALSLNEEVSEVTTSEQQQSVDVLDQPMHKFSEDLSFGANLVSGSIEDPAETSAASIELSSKQIGKVRDQEDALERATEELEAALDDAMDVTASDAGEVDTNEPNAMLGADEQHALELESDDIERHDPRGHASDERAKSPNDKVDQQQSLIASAIEAVAMAGGSGDAENEQSSSRLAVISPDEAIGSGPPSPAVPSSNGASSSDEGAESDQDKENQASAQQQQGKQGVGGNKNKKKNRNKKRGKK